MRGWPRRLLVNLTGALLVGLAVGLLMSVRIGGPPFWRPLPYNFLLAFVPYALAALLAPRFTAKFGNPRVAECVFISVAGSSLSWASFYPTFAGFALPPPERALEVFFWYTAFLVPYVLFGFIVLAAVNGLAAVVGGSSYR